MKPLLLSLSTILAVVGTSFVARADDHHYYEHHERDHEEAERDQLHPIGVQAPVPIHPHFAEVDYQGVSGLGVEAHLRRADRGGPRRA